MGPFDVIGITPFGQPLGELLVALRRAGAVGVLDIGFDPERAACALSRAATLLPDGFGVRVPDGVDLDPASLPDAVDLVVLPAGEPVARWRPRRVLVQAVSLEEARAAAAAGADGVIAKGAEAGGRVGAEGAFVLFQKLVRELDVPVFVQGGIGPHTAAACRAGGAAGVVLDTQLALVAESAVPAALRELIARLDGSETAVVSGQRVLARRTPAAEEASPLPAGQDVAFARPLAERFRTTRRVVRAIREAAEDGVRSATVTRSLGTGAPFAAAHGLRYPIAQGPMTRVSDVPAFAEAVAGAGALPFVALALMRGPEARRVLEETAERLRGRPWGVGILGFVPAELREEQLEVVRQVRPPVALIAGGRPEQARPLEEHGIVTYLHVPSPGLLEQFLRRGARRFVFEGRECGGHVGPRTSFALWESQLDILLRHDEPGELSVLFAGGIHDSRSAAMVEALAAPLAARGAKVGVLMGTAYLFTEEAVATGAIKPAFQEAAIACTGTALLETAPGHATRCAETEYVRTFTAESERLVREGVAARESWETLEQLNLGRLRLAAKGLRRDGDRLAEVSADEQRREGMVMLGEVAALRDATCTIAELHEEVSTGAGRVLAAAAPEPVRARPVPPAADVAIVGMAGLFPGAPDLPSFWANVVAGVDAITEVPPGRWSVERFYDPTSLGGERTPSKWGGFLDAVPFDPAVYGIPPLSLAAIEPAQLLALEVARRALADAGYLERDYDRERASVIFGAESSSDLSGGYVFRALWRQYVGDLPPALDEVLPRLTEDSFPGMLANVIAGRIANRLDLGGANYTVDAACASSLAAVDLAVKELRVGTSDVVLCGAVDLHNAINDYLVFSAVHALSTSGRCRTFDAAADGIVLGEGVAALVLKRLEDAVDDGDRIYAVIKGVGSSSDGRSLGLTAPRREGQVRALERAYRQAGLSPAEVGLVEAHGTGTVVGDRTELETLNTAFAAAGAAAGTCALGSVKSQIGHTKCTAGLAGMIKAALALERGVLPPTSNITAPNPSWDPERSPFTLSDAARPWPGRERRAAVSAFGFGGTNFHVVLAEHGDVRPAAALDVWPTELLLFRGATPDEARERAGALARLVERDPTLRLRDLARSVGSGEGPVQLAVIARDLPDLAAKLERAGRLDADGADVHVAAGTPPSRPTVAFLFPGQGSQRIGMLIDLFVAFPRLQRLLELGAGYWPLVHPPTAWTPEARAAQIAALTDTRAAQPALGIAGLAMAELLAGLGVVPDVLGGHSYGELVALCAAGALSETALLRLSEARARCILDAVGAGADPGAMAAVGARRDAVAPLLDGLERLVVANDNAPDQVVISGPSAAVDAAVARLQEAGLSARLLPVACAFHSPVVAAAAGAFATALEATELVAPARPVFANVSAAPHPADPDGIRSLLARQVAEPVRFVEQVEAMYAAGARVFVEAGPGRVLTGLVGRILGDRAHLAVACDAPGEHGLTQLQRALAALAVAGVAIEQETLYRGRDAERIDLADPPTRRPAPTAWLVDGMTARPQTGEPPPHALRPVLGPVAGALPVARPTGGDREEVVVEYLRTVRELAAAQREIVLGYLGSDGAPPPSSGPEPAAAAARAAEEPPPPPAAVAPAPDARPASLEDVLLAIVSERTGYPVEMLGLDVDLEADLSIDSIKRIEILGALDERLGGVAQHEVPEELVAVKTLRGIVELIERAIAATGAPVDAPDVKGTDEQPVAPGAGNGEHTSAAEVVRRYVVVVEAAPAAADDTATLAGARVHLVDDGGRVAPALAERLRSIGAHPAVLGGDDPPGGADALVDLSLLASGAGPDGVKRVFERMRAALAEGTGHVLVATALGGSLGRGRNGAPGLPAAGVAGLVKSVARERPGLRIRSVDLDPARDEDELAGQLALELACTDAVHEVGYAGGARLLTRAVPSERPSNGAPARIELTEDAVVLLTGGARGITARVAESLARRCPCRFVLVGRTPAPAGGPDPELAAAADAPSLRRALAARGDLTSPAEIDAACRRILAEREIAATLDALRQAGATVEYHTVDVRDEAAFGGLIDDVYERCGRLDGVIHAAGVIEDRLLEDKSPESFARVYDTKVAGALTLAAKLRDDVRFVCFFSSVAAAFGNRGQVDYAAANDFLDKLAVALNERMSGRVFSINWGPWKNGGMVSRELERELERHGIGLIAPAEGVESFLAELSLGAPDDAQVVLMKADPASLR